MALIELPRPLAPWAAALSLFPREIAVGLGPLVQRLAALAGELDVHAGSETGEPDGYDGLWRRGPIERLLTSEWALHDEVPDEFTRRALMGEQTYLRLARREPASAKASVALFDAGANQLGSPRLAQLAALIVLARRAEAAGAPFLWGVLQDSERTLRHQVTAAGLLHLLEARRADDATPEQAVSWWAMIESRGTLILDRWLVGGAALAQGRGAEGAFHLHLSDVLETTSRRVAARLRLGHRELGGALLDLPPPDDTVQLLRDPFRIAAAAPTSLAPGSAAASNLVFASRGGKALARSPAGGLVAYPIPSSARERPGRPRVLGRELGLLAGADWIRRAALAVSVEDDALVLSRCRRDGSVERQAGVPRVTEDGHYFEAPGPEAPLHACTPADNDATPRSAYVLDAAGALFLLRAAPEPHLSRMATDVHALAGIPDGLLYVGCPKDSSEPALVAVRRSRPSGSYRFPGGIGAAFLGCGPYPGGLSGVEQMDGSWLLLNWLTPGRTVPPPEGEVVGVFPGLRGVHRPGLLVLSPDRRRLVLESLPELTMEPAFEAIRHVAASAVSAHLGYVTVAGEIVILSGGAAAPILRHMPGAS